MLVMLLTGKDEYEITAVTLARRLSPASAAAQRDRSGRIATASAAAVRTRTATPNAADRPCITLRPGIDDSGDHQTGGGWTDAATAFRPNLRPPVGPAVPWLSRRLVRLPTRAVNSWIAGAIQQARPARAPTRAHR